MAIRSGRFSFTSTAANTPQKIISAKKPEYVVRIFNSGSMKFEVLVNGSKFAEVNPKYTIDIAKADSVEIKTSKSETTATGIYEYLLEGQDVRSGRFDTENPRFKDDGTPIDAANQYDAILIANFSLLKHNKDFLFYRFFNSGLVDYGIFLSEDMSTQPTKKIEVVKVDQSFDLQIPLISTKKELFVWVKTETPDKHIDGSFDYLDADYDS